MRNNHKTFDDRYCTTKFAKGKATLFSFPIALGKSFFDKK